MDNRSAELSRWNDDLLPDVIQGLRETLGEEFDLTTIGFTESQLSFFVDDWSTDIQSVEKTEASDAPVFARIIVKCREEDKEEVRAAVVERVEKLEKPDVSVE
jgi:hypothetical protein